MVRKKSRGENVGACENPRPPMSSGGCETATDGAEWLALTFRRRAAGSSELGSSQASQSRGSRGQRSTEEHVLDGRWSRL